ICKGLRYGDIGLQALFQGVVRLHQHAPAIQTLAQAESDRRRMLMEADNALEKRLEAFVQVSEAYAGAIRDKRLVPEVIVSGNGEGNSQSNASDLIALLMAKTARDLGVAVSEPDRVKSEIKP
ncbi:MAG: hypothetical protein N0E37_07550, partial [Candidatus Thiodiazotropha taylori]|nr:hypothetical protein [Candidatus Thiodiazotropha taylori]MCW4244278.1 hypothetical protein [Candidatus Thiodiazotropha taylori]